MNSNERTVAIAALVCVTLVLLTFSACEVTVAKYRYAAKQSAASATVELSQ
jgi:hypothetical protein